MKKTCGALIVGLITTTSFYSNVYANNAFCKDRVANALVQPIIAHSNGKWKPTEQDCTYIMGAVDLAYKKGLEAGASLVECPPCNKASNQYDPSVTINNIEKAQERNRAEADGYYRAKTEDSIRQQYENNAKTNNGFNR